MAKAGAAKGKPLELAGMVKYAKGSIVSRTLLNKKAGTLTLFAFDKGEGLSEHSTPHDAVVEVVDGTVEITIGGTPYQVSGGEALLLPANIPHGLTAVTSFKMLLIMIRG